MSDLKEKNVKSDEVSDDMKVLDDLTSSEYKWGFVTEIESETAQKGLNEEIVRFISKKKEEPEWMAEWRLKAFRYWQKMIEPHWPNVEYQPIDYQNISYYSAPKQKPKLNSLDEVDPELLKTFEKLGIPIEEQKILSGVAVDAVFDSFLLQLLLKIHLRKKE